MEKVLLLSPSQAEKAGAAALKGFRTFMVGSEFCQNQVPSPEALARLKELTGGRVLLATSLLTDAGLARWARLLAAVKGAGLAAGAVVNDFGLFPLLKKAGLKELSLGRLLLRDFVNMEKGWARAFLKANGVAAAEADTPSLAREAAAKLGLKISWHPGGVFMAVTTYCPFEEHFKAVCAHTCEGRRLALKHAGLDLPLELREKAYFAPVERAERAGFFAFSRAGVEESYFGPGKRAAAPPARVVLPLGRRRLFDLAKLPRRSRRY